MTTNSPSIEGKQDLGQPVPDFFLPSLDGEGNRSLQDYLAGKMGAVIVFWSAICTHCLRYDEYFSSFTQAHPRLGFLAIASRFGETPAQMRSAISQRRLRFPILVDQSAHVAREWRSQQTPRCYLINTDRRLLYRGAVDNFKHATDPEYVAYLEPAIRSFLRGDRIAKAETASFGCAIETVYYQLPKHL
jgi:peroxiredoxin